MAGYEENDLQSNDKNSHDFLDRSKGVERMEKRWVWMKYSVRKTMNEKGR